MSGLLAQRWAYAVLPYIDKVDQPCQIEPSLSQGKVREIGHLLEHEGEHEAQVVKF